MASQINASNSGFGGIVSTGDSSGVLQLQTAGTTAVTIDTSQRVGFVAGTAAAPAITRTGDTNTGMFFPAADTIAFAEGGTEAMRLDANGNVGIGTTSPNISSATTKALTITSASGQDDAMIEMTQDSTIYGRLYSNGNGLGITGVGGIGMRFYTASTFAGAAERMRITSTGTVLINATSLGSNTGTLYVAGAIASQGTTGRQGANGTSNGNLINFAWVNPSLQAWVDTTNVGNVSLSSDYRIKKNVETQTTPALDRIAQIRPVTYEFANYKELFKEDGVAREGFIAHELAEVIPSAVDGEKDAENQIQSLKLDALCSVMVKAIQEQQTIINDLKARIETLEAK